jgi:LemA protein
MAIRTAQVSKLVDDVTRRLHARKVAASFGPKSWLERNRLSCRLIATSLLLMFYCLGAALWYNTDILELNAIAAAKSKVDQEFRRREDLRPNLTNTVANCARHERVLFQHVSDMRAQLQSLEGLAAAPSSAQSTQIEQAFMQLTALAEQYPDLKAGECFRALAEMSEATEDRVADALDEYIVTVNEFNRCNQRFWCNYFTYPIAGLVPMPAFFEYYHTDQIHAPLVPADGAGQD